MTMPLSVGSVASKTYIKLPQLHYYRNLALRTLHRSFAVGNSDGMAMYNRPRPVSNLSQTSSTRKEGRPQKTWSDNVWRLMSMSVAQLALTHLTDAWRASVRRCSVLPTTQNCYGSMSLAACLWMFYQPWNSSYLHVPLFCGCSCQAHGGTPAFRFQSKQMDAHCSWLGCHLRLTATESSCCWFHLK